MTLIKYILITYVALLFIGCGASIPTDLSNPESIFNSGVKYLENEDFPEAKRMFDLIVYQYPASQFADDAQFYQGELSFNKGEYILAAFNYNRVRKQYPSSIYVKDAVYKTALSYYKLSPTYDRDQDYTHKAIEALQEFQYLYPDDKLYSEVSEKIQELRNKLAYRDLFTAQLYMKMDNPRSSIIYYESVINSYSDTDSYEEAFLGKIGALVYMKKDIDAESMIIAYKSNFPNSQKLQELDKMLESIKK